MTTNAPSTSRFRRAFKGASVAALLILLAPQQLWAQDGATAVPAPGLPVATLDRDALFLRSKFGVRVQQALEEDRSTLEAENRRIEAELIAEEQALTVERPDLSPAEFAKKADAFDVKVQRIRQEQDQKGLDLQRQLERERQTFLVAIIPVLNDLLAQQGTAVLLDRNAVIFAVQAVDITEHAIALIDDRIGDGASHEPADPAAPDPTAAQ